MKLLIFSLKLEIQQPFYASKRMLVPCFGGSIWCQKEIFLPSKCNWGEEGCTRKHGLFSNRHFHRLSVSSFQDKPLDFALTLISDKCLRFTLAFNKAAGDHYPVTTLYSTDTIS